MTFGPINLRPPKASSITGWWTAARPPWRTCAGRRRERDRCASIFRGSRSRGAIAIEVFQMPCDSPHCKWRAVKESYSASKLPQPYAAPCIPQRCLAWSRRRTSRSTDCCPSNRRPDWRRSSNQPSPLMCLRRTQIGHLDWQRSLTLRSPHPCRYPSPLVPWAYAEAAKLTTPSVSATLLNVFKFIWSSPFPTER